MATADHYAARRSATWAVRLANRPPIKIASVCASPPRLTANGQELVQHVVEIFGAIRCRVAQLDIFRLAHNRSSAESTIRKVARP